MSVVKRLYEAESLEPAFLDRYGLTLEKVREVLYDHAGLREVDEGGTVAVVFWQNKGRVVKFSGLVGQPAVLLDTMSGMLRTDNELSVVLHRTRDKPVLNTLREHGWLSERATKSKVHMFAFRRKSCTSAG